MNRLKYRVQPEASPVKKTSYKQDGQPPQTDHLLVKGHPPVLVEHAPPEDPGVEVPEEPNPMPGHHAEPERMGTNVERKVHDLMRSPIVLTTVSRHFRVTSIVYLQCLCM